MNIAKFLKKICINTPKWGAKQEKIQDNVAIF